MQRNLLRILIALILSIGGYVGTEYWFRSSTPLVTVHKERPIARLFDLSLEVQRKPAGRVIWERLHRGDEVFTGESIRTVQDSQAHLRLFKNGASVHLDPESLIVLEENDRGLVLDFLEGHLLVEAGEEAPGELTLKSSEGELRLQAATDIAMSKDDKGKVDIEVIRGVAQLDSGGKTQSLSRQSPRSERIQILRPIPGVTIKGESVQIQWKPIGDSYHIVVEGGVTRQKLAPLDNAIANGSTGVIDLPRPPGLWFLRLQARSEKPGVPALSSNVFQVRLESEPLPLPAETLHPPTPSPVPYGPALRPTPPPRPKAVAVTNRPLSAPLWSDNVPYIIESEGDVRLEWQPVKGAKNYLLILESAEGEPVETQTVRRTTASLQQIKPGQYHVQVQAMDESRTLSAKSPKRRIEVRKSLEMTAPKIKSMKVK